MMKMSGQQEEWVHFVTYSYIVLFNVIAICGLMGNAFTIIVLSYETRSAFICLLQGLAACDFMFILIFVPVFDLITIYTYMEHLHYHVFQVLPYLILYAYPIMYVALTTSIYLTLIVLAERWLTLCNPARANILCTYMRAWLFMLGAAAFALGFNIPRFFELNVKEVQGESYYVITKSQFYNKPFIEVYYWLSLIYMYIVPILVLIVLSVFILRQMRRACGFISYEQKEEIKHARMMLVVVLVFCLCNQMPLADTVSYFLGDQYDDSKLMVLLVALADLLQMINHSVKFVIYATVGEKFK